jgi:hypothetical protein
MLKLEYSIPKNPNPIFSNRENTLIDIDVFFPTLNEVVRYTASIYSPECPHSEEIFKRAISGEFGEVCEYQRNLDIEWNNVRAMRNDLLSQSDWTQVPDNGLKNKEQWKLYRQALRDITENLDDPDNVVWPKLEDFKIT